jgi:hypothetical protein
MELLLLVPLIWISPKISLKWKIATAGLALFEIVHVMWVFSVASTLERAEEVQSAFGFGHVGSNFLDNIKYLFNPFAFPIMISVLATLSLWERVAARVARARQGEAVRDGDRVRVSGLRQILKPSPGASRLPLPKGEALIVWVVGLFAVYLSFYAGSFDTNTRYSIQILAPLTLLAASFARRWVWIAPLLLSAFIPAAQPYAVPPSVQALQTDHDLSVLFASRIQPNDFVISGVQEVFIDQGRRAVNASFASTLGPRLNEEIRESGKVWYHSGVRANVPNTDEWRADRWVKSNFELHLIDSHEVGGFRIAFYEILTNRSNRETG